MKQVIPQLRKGDRVYYHNSHHKGKSEGEVATVLEVIPQNYSRYGLLSLQVLFKNSQNVNGEKRTRIPYELSTFPQKKVTGYWSLDPLTDKVVPAEKESAGVKKEEPPVKKRRSKKKTAVVLEEKPKTPDVEEESSSEEEG